MNLSPLHYHEGFKLSLLALILQMHLYLVWKKNYVKFKKYF